MRFNTGEVITAMVTPMDSKGNVDYKKVETLSKYLSENGSDAIVVVGTTGESPTLTHEEEIEILRVVKKSIKNNIRENINKFFLFFNLRFFILNFTHL